MKPLYFLAIKDTDVEACLKAITSTIYGAAYDEVTGDLLPNYVEITSLRDKERWEEGVRDCDAKLNERPQ